MVFIPGLSRTSPFSGSVPRTPLPTDPLMQFQSGGVPVNVFEQLNPEPLALTQAAEQMQAPQINSVQIPEQLFKEEKPQRERRSFLDTVGRIADVIATVGGAEALYQPTLDSRADRARMVDIEAMKKRQMEQQLGEGDEGIADRQRARVGMAMRGLQAIQARGGDINAAWPLLAQRAGIGPEETQLLAEAFAKDPNAVQAVTAMFGQEKEFGLQPFYATDEAGNVQAFQIGKDGSIQPIALPEGSQPVDPLKFVDTGGAQVGVGTRTGRPIRILPKGVDPNTGARIASSERIAGANINSREKIAASKGAGKTGGADSESGTQSALDNISELRGIYGGLKKSGAMVTPGQSTGANIFARARSSGAGQLVEGAVGTEAQTKRDRINSIRPGLMQSLAKATGMTGKQLDSNADVKLFMQTVTDPTASYEANMAALDGLERFVLANRKKPAAAPRPAPRRNTGRIAPRGSGKPSVSNW